MTMGLGEKDFREAKQKFEVAYLTKQLGEPSLECFPNGGDDWVAPAKLAGKIARVGNSEARAGAGRGERFVMGDL